MPRRYGCQGSSLGLAADRPPGFSSCVLSIVAELVDLVLLIKEDLLATSTSHLIFGLASWSRRWWI